jgi:hypothetical protein
MKVKLKARDLWSAVEFGSNDHQEDMMAMVVASKDMDKAAWDTIKTMRVGDDRVKAAAAQHLLHQFESTEFKEESIKDYSMRLSSMVQHLATLGETVPEPKVMGKLLCSVPHR